MKYNTSQNDNAYKSNSIDYIEHQKKKKTLFDFDRDGFYQSPKPINPYTYPIPGTVAQPNRIVSQDEYDFVSKIFIDRAARAVEEAKKKDKKPLTYVEKMELGTFTLSLIERLIDALSLTITDEKDREEFLETFLKWKNQMLDGIKQ